MIKNILSKTHSKARLIIAAAATLFAFAATGCENISQSTPVKGGTYQVATQLADHNEILAQGYNASSPSRLLRSVRSFDPQGNLLTQVQTKVELGISRDPIVTLRPVPAYGQYAVAAIGALALIGGAVLAFRAWPKIGATTAIGGFVVMIIGLTAGTYGWLWALLAAGICAVAIAMLYSGYRSGLSVAQPAEPAPAAG